MQTWRRPRRAADNNEIDVRRGHFGPRNPDTAICRLHDFDCGYKIVKRFFGIQSDYRTLETLLTRAAIAIDPNDMLELDSRVEITFQTSGVPSLQSSIRQARVVRRTLANWPETRLIFGARFLSWS